MSCNISIPIQKIIDDVAEAMAGLYIRADNSLLTDATLQDVTLRGDIIADTAAREALCLIMQGCNITAAELDWLEKPGATGQVLVGVSGEGEAVEADWRSLRTLVDSYGYADKSRTKFSFDTYAQMVAAKEEIPSGATIDIANDTTAENNGTYRYNGTTFSKALYDPATALANALVEVDQSLDAAIDGVADTVQGAVEAREIERNTNYLLPKTFKRILFVGDSLIDRVHDPKVSYANMIAGMLADKAGGYKELGYVALSTDNPKELADVVTISRTNMTDMWGASDHKYNQLPFSYSPDGRGFYTDITVAGGQQIFFRGKGVISATKIRLYYLKQPNGGSFHVGYSNVGAGSRTVVNTQAPTPSLGILDMVVANPTDTIVLTVTTNDNKLAVYGMEFINEKKTTGISYNILARAGVMLQSYNYLQANPAYYAGFAPEAVFLNIGTNDALQDFSRLSREGFKYQMTIWMDQLRQTLPNVRVYIIEPNRSSIYGTDAAGDGEGLLLEQYTAVRKEIVATYENCEYIDIPALMGDYEYFNESGFMYDALHPNALGKYNIARTIIKYLGLEVNGYSKIPFGDVTTAAAARVSGMIELLPLVKTVNVNSTAPELLATFGLQMDSSNASVNAYFDLLFVLSKTGKQFAYNVRFYAFRTGIPVNPTGVRGVTVTLANRGDNTSSVSKVDFTVALNADNNIIITAVTDNGEGPAFDLVDMVMAGKVYARTSDFVTVL